MLIIRIKQGKTLIEFTIHNLPQLQITDLLPWTNNFNFKILPNTNMAQIQSYQLISLWVLTVLQLISSNSYKLCLQQIIICNNQILSKAMAIHICIKIIIFLISKYPLYKHQPQLTNKILVDLSIWKLLVWFRVQGLE